jgi:acetolactate synthase-1/2/3 large subunit
VIYAGGGVLSARATAELTALADALEVPVAHTLMGKGCLHERHPLLLGQTGFWGLPVANEACKRADLILAVGTRLAEANSSSWDPRFTFAIPPTRLIHIDIDSAEIGRNYPTELGVVADAKAALGVLASTVRGEGTTRAARCGHRRGGRSPPTTIPVEVKPVPMRPERILSDLRRALLKDGFWSQTSAGTRTASRSISHHGSRHVHRQRPRHMGFGQAAVLGMKMAFPDRAAVSLVGDSRFSANPSVVATAMEADLPVVWVVMDNDAGTIAGLSNMHYGSSFAPLQRHGKTYRTDYAAMARSFSARALRLSRLTSCIRRS